VTLSIRISTPVGLVFCSDSLVTYTDKVELLDREKSGEYIPPGAISESSPPYLTNPRTKDREFVVSTTPNISKVHRISNLPIAYSVAGHANFLVSNVQGGRYNETNVPFEAFIPVVDKVIGDLIEKNPDVNIQNICKCACHALSCGVNGVHDVNTPGWSLAVLGGGYSPASPWPHVFDFDLRHEGQDTEVVISILDASTGSFCRGVGVCLPNHSSSINMFSEFCENDLEKCLISATLNACIWSSFFSIDEEIFRNQVIDDTLKHMKQITLLIGRILTRWGLESLQSYQFSDVISEMWGVREDDYKDEISTHYEEIFDNFIENNQSTISMMLEHYDDARRTQEHCNEIESVVLSDFPLYRSLSEEEWQKTSTGDRDIIGVLFDRLDAKTQVNMDYNSYYGLCRLLGIGVKEGYIQSVGTGDLMFVEEWGHPKFSYWSPRWAYFGIEKNGQTDVIEKIIQGIDRPTRRRTEKSIRDYTIKTTERLGELIEAGLEGREPSESEINNYGSGKIQQPPKFSIDSPEDDEGEDEDESVDDLKPHIGFGPGAWTGFYIFSPESADETIRNKFSMEFTYDSNGNLTGSGNSYEGDINAELQTDESGTTLLNISLEGSDSYKESNKKFSVEGNLESWGFNGGFADGEEWRSFIMWPVDNLHSEVDSISVIQGAIRTLHSELENFPFQTDSWNIEWEFMPLETAVELAHYLMESTIKKQHFNREVPTVGGKIKTVTISHDGEYREF